MLTISVLEEENQNTSALNKTASTGITDSYNNSEQQKAQQEADEHIKNKIRGMLNKQEDQADISESPVSAISQRRQRKNFWRNVGMYFTTGGWGLGIGDWGLGIGPNPQSPIPNPQSPISVIIIFQ
jgi:hypothetical protein